MADRVEVFDVTIPAGTARTAPTVTPTPYAQGYLQRVEVVIPDGVAGLAGFQIGYDTQPVIPNTDGAFIVGNDEVWRDEPRDFPVGGRATIIGYNTDGYDHTLHVRYYVTEIGAAPPPPVTPFTVTPLDVTPEVTPEDLPPVDTGTDDGQPPELPPDEAP